MSEFWRMIWSQPVEEGEGGNSWLRKQPAQGLASVGRDLTSDSGGEGTRCLLTQNEPSRWMWGGEAFISYLLAKEVDTGVLGRLKWSYNSNCRFSWSTSTFKFSLTLVWWNLGDLGLLALQSQVLTPLSPAPQPPSRSPGLEGLQTIVRKKEKESKIYLPVCPWLCVSSCTPKLNILFMLLPFLWVGHLIVILFFLSILHRFLKMICNSSRGKSENYFFL